MTNSQALKPRRDDRRLSQQNDGRLTREAAETVDNLPGFEVKTPSCLGAEIV